MKNRRKLFLFIFTSIVLANPLIGVACTIEEVVDMVSDGSGYDAIRRGCDRRVDDAPRCSLREVIQFAQADKDEYDIKERCGLCERPICNTQYGPCVIVVSDGSRFREGGPCGCATPMGYIPGRAACDN